MLKNLVFTPYLLMNKYAILSILLYKANYNMASQMNKEARQEKLHKAYISTLAAKLGLINTIPDDFGVDGYLHELIKGKNTTFPSGHALAYQLKSSSSNNKYSIKENFVHYEMDSDAYNKLVDQYCNGDDCLLILFCMPEDENEWIELKETELKIRKCCYWEIIKETIPIKKKSSKTIKIPRTQILDTEKLLELMVKVKNGVRL